MDKEQTNELDERLKQLAIAAQKHPPKSRERNKYLTQIYEEIRLSRRLCRPSRERSDLEGMYEEIYAEALQELWLYMCKNIDRYDPNRSPVMRWLNFYLKQRFMPQEIEKIKSKQIQPMTLEELDNIQPLDPDKKALLDGARDPLEDLKQYILEDPENIGKSKHIENHPSATFQAIAQRKLDGQSWKAISEELGIKIPTLSRFYERTLKKLAPKIREYCKD